MKSLFIIFLLTLSAPVYAFSFKNDKKTEIDKLSVKEVIKAKERKFLKFSFFPTFEDNDEGGHISGFKFSIKINEPTEK
jgi:hypothetical protein